MSGTNPLRAESKYELCNYLIRYFILTKLLKQVGKYKEKALLEIIPARPFCFKPADSLYIPVVSDRKIF